MLKVLTKLRNAGPPLQTCHFVVGWFVTICQFVDVFDKVRFQSKKAYFFLKIGRFDTKSFNSSLFYANSSGEILITSSIIERSLYPNGRKPLSSVLAKAPCKWTHHCWPTAPVIVGCYMLHPFAHPVAFCCVLLREV